MSAKTSSKIYSLYFPEEVVTPTMDKTSSQILKELLMELVAIVPLKNVSESLRPTLLTLKSHFYKSTEKEIAELEEIDQIASKLLEKKKNLKLKLTEKVNKI